MKSIKIGVAAILVVLLYEFLFYGYFTPYQVHLKKERLCNNYEITRSFKAIDEENEFKEKLEASRKLIKSFPQPVIAEYLTFPGNYKYTAKDLRHVLPLALSVLITEGDIMDLAIDLHTTQVLRNIAKEQNRFLLSIENNAQWLINFIDWNNTNNHLLLESSSECVSSIKKSKKWGLITVDHLDVIRIKEIHNFIKSSQILFIYSTKIQDYEAATFESRFKFTCKSLLSFDDGTYSAVYIYTDLSNKFEILESSLQRFELKNSKYECQSLKN